MQVLRGAEFEEFYKKEIEQLKVYKFYIESLKSPATKKVYLFNFKKFVEYLGKDAKNILCNKDPIFVQDIVKEYLISLKEKSLGFSALKNYVIPIISFYKINDVIINTKSIFRLMPEQIRVRKDRAYTREEIQALLDVADDRYRAIILLYASSGIRLGAIPDLKYMNLKKLENDIYQVTVYENTTDEYVTFTTPECSRAIDKYIEFRKRYGEEINDGSPVFREQFDTKNQLVIQHPKKLKYQTIDRILTSYSERAGLRKREKLDKNGTKRGSSCRKDVPVCHGLRKFFCTQLVNSDLNTERRWLLEGRALLRNDPAYVGTSKEQLLEQYMKAVNNLTINDENRLLIENKILKQDKVTFEKLDSKIDALARAFFKNNVRLGTDNMDFEDMKPLTDDEIEDRIQWNKQKRIARRRAENKLSSLN